MEEKHQIIFYTNQIKEIIMRKSPSRSLKTYALTFFRRFYLRKTAIDYDPDYLLCAALFLGFKVAQMSVNIETMKNICPFLKEKHTEKNVENILLLLEYEFYLINILNYDLYVFCPYKAMVGFLYSINNNQKVFDIKILSDTNEQFTINAKEFEIKVENFIDQTYLTDLIFLYTYSYLALSCIFLAAEFYQIKFELIRTLLELDKIINYDTFLNDIYLTVKENINSIKILSDEEFVNNKKKILKFLIKQPKYTERIERDRE